MGSWFRYTLGNLKVDGDFTLKIMNKNAADDGTSNHYRWVVDNIEWYSYEAPKYAVTFEAPEHGLLSVLNGSAPLTSGDEVKAGTELTIVPTPGDGYQVKSVTVNDTPIEAVEDVYSYTMGSAAAVIAATFEKKTATGVDEMNVEQAPAKEIRNGQLLIIRDGAVYTAVGQRVK